MRTDTYTKAVLTVIAVFLGMLVFKQYVRPDVVAQAQGGFAGVQVSPQQGQAYVFDSRTGDIVWYDGPKVLVHRRLAKVGQPLVDVK
jgi:hypothetical protein